VIKKITFIKIESTNKYALENIDNIEDKTVIVARVQTKGRGRNARNWVSKKNNLFVSLVLKPQYKLEKKYTLNALTHYTAVVLARVFKEKYSIETKIKWPNDIIVDEKKIAGILIETVIQGYFLQGVVIGIGVNLNMDKRSLKTIDQPATSLNILLKRKINTDRFLDYLLEEFFTQYDELLKQGFLLIKEEYNSRNMVLGKMVEVDVFNKKYYGMVKEIDDKGQLVLNCNNTEKIISVGDIVC
jgi:BirA family transcriptional regulator, biotin operon repressor / biotin---[acetyl-CoA-carboxylase] ligase